MTRPRTLLAWCLAVLAGGVGLSIAGQHGHGHAPDAGEHFQAVAERLSLSEAQQETLEAPFQEAFEALQELHRLHGVIAAELTAEQKEELARMIHDALGASGQGHRN